MAAAAASVEVLSCADCKTYFKSNVRFTGVTIQKLEQGSGESRILRVQSNLGIDFDPIDGPTYIKVTGEAAWDAGLRNDWKILKMGEATFESDFPPNEAEKAIIRDQMKAVLEVTQRTGDLEVTFRGGAAEKRAVAVARANQKGGAADFYRVRQSNSTKP